MAQLMEGGLKMPLLGGIEAEPGERRKRYGVRCSLDLGNPWHTNVTDHRPSLDFALSEQTQRGWGIVLGGNGAGTGIGSRFERCIWMGDERGGGRGASWCLKSRGVTGHHSISVCLLPVFGLRAPSVQARPGTQIRGIVGCTGGTRGTI